MKNLIYFTAVLFLFSIITFQADAQFLWDPDGVELRKTTHINYQSLAAGNSLGEIFIVWMDSRDGRSKIYAQKYDAEGNTLWDEDVQVADNQESDQFGQLIVCPTSDDGFILVWGKQLWPDCNMIANKVDRDGNVLWGAEGIDLGEYLVAFKLETFYNIFPTDDGGFSIVFCKQGHGEEIDLYAKRILSDGSIALGWEEEGNLIAEHISFSDDFTTFACSDDANGLIVSWREYLGFNQHSGLAQHIDSSGELMWGAGGIEITTSPGIYSLFSTSKDGNGGAFFIWMSAEGFDMQRVDDSGSRLWGDAGLTLCNQPDNQSNVMIKYDGLGGFIAAWEDERNPYTVDIYCQRVNQNGDKLWGANDLALCTMAGTQSYVRIDADGAGGLSASWRHWESGGLSHQDVYVQAVSADGQICWQNNGVLISGGTIDNAYGHSVVSIGQGEALFTMRDAFENLNGIYIQCIDQSGNVQFPYPGEPVVESLSGGACNFELMALDDNNFICVWQDTRWGLTSGYQTYFQIFDADANIELPENGVPIYESSPYNQEYPKTAVTSNGNAIICWEDDRVSSYDVRLYAQMIDGDGNILWNPSGVQLSTYDNRQCNAMILADEEGGAYVVWRSYQVNTYVIIQHIDAGGNILFGSEGLRIDWNISDDWAELIGLVPDGENGLIIVYDDKDTNYIHALRVLEYATVAWDNCVYNLGERNYGAFVIPSREGAIVVWEDERISQWGHDIYAQKVDFNGNVLWTTNGVPVIIRQIHNQRYPAMVEDEEGYIFFAWEDKRNGNGNEDIYCQRLNSDGEIQFNEAGTLVCENEGNVDNIKILPDGDCGVFLTWEDERTEGYWDIYATHLDSDGSIAEPVWQEYGNPVVDEVGGQHHPWMVPDGDGGAVVVWEDGRAASGSDLYMQRFNDTYASISGNDNIIPDEFSFRQNYPNPFNPSTTLSFDLPSAMKVQLIIFDLTGREVAKLIDGHRNAGSHEIIFDAGELSSGFYFVTLEAGDFRQTRKVLLVK